MKHIILFLIIIFSITSCNYSSKKKSKRNIDKSYIIIDKSYYKNISGKTYCNYSYNDINGNEQVFRELSTMYKMGDTLPLR